jgi:hypothetical protein
MQLCGCVSVKLRNYGLMLLAIGSHSDRKVAFYFTIMQSRAKQAAANVLK